MCINKYDQIRVHISMCQGWQVSTQHGNYPGNYRVITDTVEIFSTLPFWVEMVET